MYLPRCEVDRQFDFFNLNLVVFFIQEFLQMVYYRLLFTRAGPKWPVVGPENFRRSEASAAPLGIFLSKLCVEFSFGSG